MKRLDRRVETTVGEEPSRPAFALDRSQVAEMLLDLSSWDAASLLRTTVDSPQSFPWLDIAGASVILAEPRAYLDTIGELARSSEDPRIASGALGAVAMIAKHVESKIFAARQISDDVLKGIAHLKAIRTLVTSLSDHHEAAIRKTAKICEHLLVNLEDRVLSRCMKLKPRDEEQTASHAKR